MEELISCSVNEQVWQCVGELRWLEKTEAAQTLINKYDKNDIIKVASKTVTSLQQKWISATGEIKWQDVPTVKDGK